MKVISIGEPEAEHKMLSVVIKILLQNIKEIPEI
jgi:hypothetical protein